jgi:hypothetical protein
MASFKIFIFRDIQESRLGGTMGLDVQREGLIQIQDNVFAQVGPEGESNQGIVVTKEGSILVDNYIIELRKSNGTKFDSLL